MAIQHVLVTGASGFVGRALVARLCANGHRVSALVRPGSRLAGAELVEHDLAGAAPPRLPVSVDTVVHLAQSRAYRTFPADAGEMFRVNVGGAQALLQAAAAARVKRFCMVSSGTVYAPFDAAMSEGAALAPRSYLGATKLAAEIVAHPYEAVFALSILRLFAPYGPGQTDRLIPDLIRRVRSGVPIDLPEGSDGMRFAPTYVDDVCDVIETAIAENWTDIVNVAMAGSITIAQAVAAIEEALGKKAIIQRKPIAAPIVVPDLTRLAARYDLCRFRKFAEGICSTVTGDK